MSFNSSRLLAASILIGTLAVIDSPLRGEEPKETNPAAAVQPPAPAVPIESSDVKSDKSKTSQPELKVKSTTEEVDAKLELPPAAAVAADDSEAEPTDDKDAALETPVSDDADGSALERQDKALSELSGVSGLAWGMSVDDAKKRFEYRDMKVEVVEGNSDAPSKALAELLSAAGEDSPRIAPNFMAPLLKELTPVSTLKAEDGAGGMVSAVFFGDVGLVRLDRKFSAPADDLTDSLRKKFKGKLKTVKAVDAYPAGKNLVPDFGLEMLVPKSLISWMPAPGLDAQMSIPSQDGLSVRVRPGHSWTKADLAAASKQELATQQAEILSDWTTDIDDARKDPLLRKPFFEEDKVKALNLNFNCSLALRSRSLERGVGERLLTSALAGAEKIKREAEEREEMRVKIGNAFKSLDFGTSIDKSEKTLEILGLPFEHGKSLLAGKLLRESAAAAGLQPDTPLTANIRLRFSSPVLRIRTKSIRADLIFLGGEQPPALARVEIDFPKDVKREAILAKLEAEYGKPEVIQEKDVREVFVKNLREDYEKVAHAGYNLVIPVETYKFKKGAAEAVITFKTPVKAFIEQVAAKFILSPEFLKTLPPKVDLDQFQKDCAKTRLKEFEHVKSAVESLRAGKPFSKSTKDMLCESKAMLDVPLGDELRLPGRLLIQSPEQCERFTQEAVNALKEMDVKNPVDDGSPVDDGLDF